MTFKCYQCKKEVEKGLIEEWGWSKTNKKFCTYKCLRDYEKKSQIKIKRTYSITVEKPSYVQDFCKYLIRKHGSVARGAKAINISDTTIKYLQSGERGKITLKVLQNINKYIEENKHKPDGYKVREDYTENKNAI